MFRDGGLVTFSLGERKPSWKKLSLVPVKK
jgi:hypothetical protein